MFDWIMKKYILNVDRKHIDFNHNRYTNHYHDDYQIDCLLKVEIEKWLDSNIRGSYRFESKAYPTCYTMGELYFKSKEYFDRAFQYCDPILVFSNKNDRLLFKLIWG